MPDAAPKIRLHVTAPLDSGGNVELEAEQTHYLRHVLRCRPGDEVAVFNAADGEWRARIESLARASCRLALAAQVRAGGAEPGPWLLFAAVKRGPLDLVVEKATELGVERLQPLLTARTVVGRVNLQRLGAIAREAAEQCGRVSVPEIREAVALGHLLDEWPACRTLIFCDTAGDAPPLASLASTLKAAASAVLVGPEGGFDEAERALLHRQPFVRAATLGPRTLRAETASIAALAVLQALAGDWQAPDGGLPAR